MKDLHLKYRTDTGDSRPMIELRDDEDDYQEVASEPYLNWLEDIAEKYFKITENQIKNH